MVCNAQRFVVVIVGMAAIRLVACEPSAGDSGRGASSSMDAGHEDKTDTGISRETDEQPPRSSEEQLCADAGAPSTDASADPSGCVLMTRETGGYGHETATFYTDVATFCCSEAPIVRRIECSGCRRGFFADGAPSTPIQGPGRCTCGDLSFEIDCSSTTIEAESFVKCGLPVPPPASMP